MPGFPLYHIYPIPSPNHTWEAVLTLSVWCLGPPRTTARPPVPRPLSSSSPAPGPLQAWANCSGASVSCHEGRRGPSKELPSGARPGSKQTAQKRGRKGKLVPLWKERVDEGMKAGRRESAWHLHDERESSLTSEPRSAVPRDPGPTLPSQNSYQDLF
uniref:Uncharacterized protein n=1 Tax=Mustela putorius furo TaxID=9669 RepID=M3Z2H8_MUSPF